MRRWQQFWFMVLLLCCGFFVGAWQASRLNKGGIMFTKKQPKVKFINVSFKQLAEYFNTYKEVHFFEYYNIGGHEFLGYYKEC